VIVGFCPLAEALLDSLTKRLYTLSEKARGLPFRTVLEQMCFGARTIILAILEDTCQFLE